MRTALSVRRALAAVTATAVAATALSLIGGAASAADLARISETPAAGSLVGPPALVSATYTQFLHPLSTIAVSNDQGPVCAATGPSPTASDDVRKTLSCVPAAGTEVTGTYTVDVLAIDTTLPAPQQLQESWTFEVDAEAPTPTGVAISPEPVTGSADAITVAASFAEAGTATFRLTSDGGGSQTRTQEVTGTGPAQVSFDPESFQDGELTASVTLEDGFGNVSEAGTDTAPIDTTAPQRTSAAPQGTATGGTAEQPTLVSATFDEDLASSSSLAVFSSTGNEVSGQDAIGSGSELPLMEDSRKITFTPTEPLRDGVYTARVTAVDQLGNSQTTTFSFTIDDTAPLSVTAVLEDPINAANVTTATVSGSGSEPGLTVSVSVDDADNPLTAAVAGTTTTGTDTAYSLDLNLSSLDDGTLTATVTATDATESGTVQATATATKDTVAPAAPTTTITPGEIGVPQQTSVAVSGTVTDGSAPVAELSGPEPAATVTVTIDDESEQTAPLVFVTKTDPEGDYAVAGIDVSGLADGTITATAVATDGVGNDSAPGSGTAEKDTTAPAAPTVLVPAYANQDNAAALPVSGTAEPASTVAIVITDAAGDSATPTATITAGNDGSYTTTVDVRGLADGALGVSATATDELDNTGPAALTELVKDTAAPGLPTIVAAAFVNADNVGAYPVSGLAEPGATVTVTIDNDVDDLIIIPPASAQDVADEDGFYSVVLDVTDQRDGALTITASATDPAGNDGEDATASRTKDTRAPGAPTDVAISADPVRAGDAVTVTGALNELDRLTPAGLTVHVVLSDTSDATVDPATSTATIGDAPESTWSVTFTPEQVALLADGVLTARATVQDEAGNDSPESTDTATKNAAPLTFVSSSPADRATVAPPATVELTFSEPLTGRDGNGNLRSTIQLRDTANQLVNCPRSFSADFRTILCTPTTSLSQAGSPYSATVTAYDSVSDTATVTISFDVDATPPASPTVDSATDPVNADSEPDVQVLLSGLAPDAATATVTISDGSRAATATVTIDGDTGSAWVDTTSLADGPLTVTATASDQYGNESSPSEPLEITKDSLQPQQTSASPTSGSELTEPPADVRLTFDEVLSDTRTVTITGPAGPVAGETTTADGGKTLVFTPTDAFPAGAYDVEADVQDLAGNDGAGGTDFVVQGTSTSPSPTPDTSVSPTPDTSVSPTPDTSVSPTPDQNTGGGNTGGGGGGGTGGSSPTPSVSTTPTTSPSPSASPSPSVAPRDGAGYVALSSPTRVLDSRNGTGTTQGLKRGRVVLDLSDRIPAGATAAVLNVTVTNPTATGFVVAYPDGNAKPGTSNVNVVAGQTQANEVVVGLPASRRVVLFVDSTSAHLIADLVGFFTETERPDLGRVVTQAPVRVLDSREGTGTTVGRKSGEVVLDLTGKVPAGTTSVALNVTVAGPDARGFVVAFPTGTVRPGTSNVNFERGQTQANEVVVRLGTGAHAGKVSLFVDSATAALIADLVASVVPRDGAGNQLFTALQQPERVLDTRSGLGGTSGRRNGSISLTLPADVVPAGATGVVLNVTSTGASRTGFVSVYPAGTANPGTSNVNFRPGVNQANEVLTAISGGRGVTLFVGGGGTPLTHVVVDVVGYLTSTG